MKALYNYLGNEVMSVPVTPEMYGAVGDGVADDSDAIQTALNDTGKIVFATGKSYKVTKTLRVKGGTLIDLAGATIVSTNKHLMFNFQTSDVFLAYNGNGNITIRNGKIIGGAISFAHGDGIRLENISFLNSLNDHFLEIAGCKNYFIENCKFVGMADVQTSVYEYINLDPCVHKAFPWLTNGSPFYDGTKNDGVHVQNCYFGLGDDAYAYGYNALGAHGVWDANTYHKDISLVNNTIRGFTGCGIRLNNMHNVYITQNDIRVAGDGIRVGDVGSCEDIVIMNNYIVSDSGEEIALTAERYTDLTVANNVSHGQNDMN